MGEVDNFVPTILDLLKKIDDKKAVFVNLPLPGAVAIMKQVLENMHNESTELSAALINLAPVRNPFMYFCGSDNCYLFSLASRLVLFKRKTLLKPRSKSSWMISTPISHMLLVQR